MLFYFFMCDDLSFINTTQKTLKPSKKMFQCPGWMRISPSQQYNLPTKITISDSPPAKTFLKFLPPPPHKLEGGDACPGFLVSIAELDQVKADWVYVKCYL